MNRQRQTLKPLKTLGFSVCLYYTVRAQLCHGIPAAWNPRKAHIRDAGAFQRFLHVGHIRAHHGRNAGRSSCPHAGRHNETNDALNSLHAKRFGIELWSKLWSNAVFKQAKTPENTAFSGVFYWQGQKDSNPQQRFWRPTCYHYTMPLRAVNVDYYIANCASCQQIILILPRFRFCECHAGFISPGALRRAGKSANFG